MGYIQSYPTSLRTQLLLFWYYKKRIHNVKPQNNDCSPESHIKIKNSKFSTN